MAKSVCIYEYKGQQFFSLEALTKFYYKSNFPLTNHNIYSTEEIVDSTLSKIREKIITIEQARDLERTQLSSLIGDKNPALMQALGLDIERFAPQYNSDERKASYIRDNLVEDGMKRDELQDKSYEELLLIEGASAHNQEIESIMDAESKSNVLMGYLRDAVKLAVVNQGDTDWAENQINLGVNRAIEQGLIEESQKDLLRNKMNTILRDIIKLVNNHGVPFSDVLMTTEPGVMQHMTGHFDLIVVDRDGTPHVYTIRSSKEDFNRWDSGKRLNVDYQLAFQRALLGQYVNINKTSLNVLPISTGQLINGKLNPAELRLGNTETRTGDPKAGLQYRTGKLFQIAAAVIPYTAKIDTNPERKAKIEKDLEKVLPGYEIKTATRRWNKERIISSIKKYGYFTDKFNIDEYSKDPAAQEAFLEIKGSRIYLKDYLGFSAEELNAKAEKMAEDYMRFLEKTNNRNVVSLKNAIVNAINKGDAKAINLYNDEQAEQAQKVLVPYLNNNYRVLDSVEELDDLGVILLQNKRTGYIVAISISAYNFKSKYNKDYYYREVEYFKVFTILNNLYDSLHFDVSKIQDILIFDVDNKTSPPGDVNTMFTAYQEWTSTQEYLDDVRITKDNLLSFEEASSKLLENVYLTYNESDKAEMQTIFRDVEGRLDRISLDELITVIGRFEARYKGLANKTFTSEVDFTKPEEYMYALLKTLLLSKYGLVPEGDAVGLRNYALKYQDFFGVVSAIYNDEIREFNKNEEPIMGAIGGLKMVTPDRVPSKDLFNINQIIATTVGLVRQEVNKKSSQIKLATRKYYKAIGFTGGKRHLIGDTRDPFRNMWMYDENHNISSKWKTKNPYIQEEGHELTDPEREYLKAVLFYINRQHLRLSDEEADKIDFSSIESIKKTASEYVGKRIVLMMETGEYFNMPLIRSKSWTRHKKIFSKAKSTREKGITGIMAETRDFIDGRELYKDDLAKIKKDTRKYNQMYEIYGKQSEEFITNAVNENGSASYEIDLDTIAHRIVLEKTKKKFIDKVLPVINSYVWWIKLNGGKINKDVSKELEYIKERIDLSFFDEPLVDSEAEDVIKAATMVKKITTPMMLALRPATFMKEVLLGMYRGASITATQFFGKDQFSFKDYSKAMKSV